MSQELHEALHFLERGPHRYAVEKAIAERDRYERALRGIAACCTVGAEDCARVARAVLANEYAERVMSKEEERGQGLHLPNRLEPLVRSEDATSGNSAARSPQARPTPGDIARIGQA